ncbi:MAG: ParB/RepB/Spo0J family partition protein [Acidimicrobiia bacterium]|nr:ParB/RepB/Spo0J family partition protein [Acidimicrobiia bacterium]
MAARKSGLGRGLEALLPSGESGQGFAMLPLGAIDPNPQQPRARFDDGALDNLAASIREVGVLQPVVVRQVGVGQYHLVAGERRWRAARMAGLDQIPAIVREGDDLSGLTEALIENLQREDLTNLEEAAAYRQLMEDFGLTHEEVAIRVGKSRSAVSNTLRLLQLPAVIQGLLEAGALTAGHCRALLTIDDTRYAESIARRAAEEGWSVRKVEEAVKARAGMAEAKPSRTTRAVARPAEILALEERLTERLGSTVRIDYGAKGGKILIRFGSLDDLERVYRSLLGE